MSNDIRIAVTKDETRQLRIDSYLEITEYITKSDSEAVSLVTARLNGPHGERVNSRSAKLYFVLGGTLDIVVDSKKFSVHPQDLILVRPGKWHLMEGHNAELLIICAPAFDSADETLK